MSLPSRARAGLAVLLLLAFATAAPAQTPPEPPGGGDAAPGAEAPGVDAVEWEALTRGSETGSGEGGLQALLASANVDLVAFYKNLNRSPSPDEDDAYHVYARRCSAPGVAAEHCGAEIVFQHLVYTRSHRNDGGYDYQVLSVSAESPVGTPHSATPQNPFGDPHGSGAVVVADRHDPRRDPTALADLASELGAATQSITETAPPLEAGVVRAFLPPENTSYPYPYERIAAVFDDSDAPDLLFVPTPSGDLADDPPRGGHGSLDVSQSRTTLVVSGRGARRTPLAPEEEAALEIRNVDVAATVARVLGIPPLAAGRHLNGGDAAANPAAPPARLLRQDGKPLEALLEKRLNVFAVVIDGLDPHGLTAARTPNLCNLIDCPGAPAPDPGARATSYEQARAVMVAQTNANHVAMMTGAYGATHGVVANAAWDRAADAEIELDRPELIRVDTLFDGLRREAPQLRTAAVMGKSKLRALFDCTTDANGNCAEDQTDNPEALPVSHVRPDFLRGALDAPALPGAGDCPAEPGTGSGYALDPCIMDLVIELSATEDPDFVFVNLGAVDGLQHASGPNNPLSEATITVADAQLGRLVDYLVESGKWQQSVLLVTSDHSFSWQGSLPTQRIDLEGAFAPCAGGSESFQQVSSGGTAHVYLDSIESDTLAPLSGAQDAMLQCLRDAALAQPGVSEAWYRFENPLDPGQSLAARRPDWHLADPRAGDLVVTALASGPGAGLGDPASPGGGPFEVASGAGYTLAAFASSQGVLPGDHGHPGARHVPFLVISGGDFVVDQSVPAGAAVNEGDDTAALPGQAEAVDVAPTVAWMLGLDPAAVLPDAEGRVLTEAFHERPIDAVEPHANRAIVFIFDGNNSVRIHELMAGCDGESCAHPDDRPVPALRELLWRDTEARSDVPVGTLTAFGSISALPSVTFPNHNVVGSGALPGHLGIVHNRYYERDIETERDPIDSQDPRNPLFFFSSALLRSDFETLHEAVHRGFGDWSPTSPEGAFTASVNEPSARGADFASLETVSSENLPAVFAALIANAADFAADTDLDCAQESPGGYGQESVLDHLGQAQARALFAEASTSGLPRPDGIDPLLIDQTEGIGHPDPKYLIANFTLTDGAGHESGPHGNCARRGYGDSARRLGRIVEELRNHGRFAATGEPARIGETFVVFTGDHGMENQDLRPGRHAGFDTGLGAADVEYVRQETFLYLLTLDVQIEGLVGGGVVEGAATALRFTVLDSDRRADGSATPVEGATVSVAFDGGGATGTTDAAGQVSLGFTPTGSQLRVLVDRDGLPSQGGRTLGSDLPDPLSHGQVSKADYNDRVLWLPEPGAGGSWLAAGALLAALRRRRGRGARAAQSSSSSMKRSSRSPSSFGGGWGPDSGE